MNSQDGLLEFVVDCVLKDHFVSEILCRIVQYLKKAIYKMVYCIVFNKVGLFSFVYVDAIHISTFSLGAHTFYD